MSDEAEQAARRLISYMGYLGAHDEIRQVARAYLSEVERRRAAEAREAAIIDILTGERDGHGRAAGSDDEPEKLWNRRPPADARAKALEACLEELHAMVWGECPSILNEDSGGNASLDWRIRELLTSPQDGGAQ